MNQTVQEVPVRVQPTPHPRAVKFILEQDVRAAGEAHYTPDHVPRTIGPLVPALLAMDHVTHVHLCGRVITVTQDGEGSWFTMEQDVRQRIASFLFLHDPDGDAEPTGEGRGAATADPEVTRVQKVLDDFVGPYLASHGGGVNVLGYDPRTHVVLLDYGGACDGCAGASGGTLHAIQGVLRQEIDPNIVVSVANPYEENW